MEHKTFLVEKLESLRKEIYNLGHLHAQAGLSSTCVLTIEDAAFVYARICSAERQIALAYLRVIKCVTYDATK
jgi:hypothetical protein